MMRRVRSVCAGAVRPRGSAPRRTLSTESPLVSNAWLSSRLPSVKVVDGSWFLPSMLRSGAALHKEGRLPGSVFFDVDKVADQSTSLPHMLPSEKDFARIAGQELGISDANTIVVYDRHGIFSAPRVRFTFQVFGATRVSLLGGGFPAWAREGYPVVSGDAVVPPTPTKFQAKLNKDLVRSYDQVLRNIDSKAELLVDARSPGRFEGIEDEPRPGCQKGHVPGAINLPFFYLLDPFTQTLLPPASIEAAFRRAGVDTSDKDRPIVAMCGSGVTACIITLGLEIIGHRSIAVYDGSWAEWGTRSGAPVVTGP